MINKEAKVDLNVEYVARLARLKLTGQEIKLLNNQLGSILNYINKLKEVDIKGIPATAHVIHIKNVFREDKVEPSLTKEEALKNAPSRQDGAFKVPPVLKWN